MYLTVYKVTDLKHYGQNITVVAAVWLFVISVKIPLVHKHILI